MKSQMRPLRPFETQGKKAGATKANAEERSAPGQIGTTLFVEEARLGDGGSWLAAGDAYYT